MVIRKFKLINKSKVNKPKLIRKSSIVKNKISRDLIYSKQIRAAFRKLPGLLSAFKELKVNPRLNVIKDPNRKFDIVRYKNFLKKEVNFYGENTKSSFILSLYLVKGKPKRYYVKEAPHNTELSSVLEFISMSVLNKLNINIIKPVFAYDSIAKKNSYICYEYKNLPNVFEALSKHLISLEEFNAIETKISYFRNHLNKYGIKDFASINALINVKTKKLYMLDTFIKEVKH
jgi:hypothetical protein